MLIIAQNTKYEIFKKKPIHSTIPLVGISHTLFVIESNILCKAVGIKFWVDRVVGL